MRNQVFSRRALLLTAGVAAAGAGGYLMQRSMQKSSLPVGEPNVVKKVGNMPYRNFGSTGMQVSEVGFGAWGIGGQAYGTVARSDSLSALARAEELGCNFVDTAAVYGDSEAVLGDFLRERRSRWIVATKYSGQPAGMTATLDEQLKRLGTDYVDFYQLHWAPGKKDRALYDELYRLKQSGRARFVGVSLYAAHEIDYVLDHTELDGFQIAFSLLDPSPFLDRIQRLRDRKLGILIRSSLKEGFLAGKFKRDAKFPDANDQRHSWTAEQIAKTVDQVEQFRFLEQEAGTMAVAAIEYPLSFPEVSTVLLGTKNVHQADSNFGMAAGGRLSTTSLAKIAKLQSELGVRTGALRQLLESVRHLV